MASSLSGASTPFVGLTMTKVFVQVAAWCFILLDVAVDGRRTDHRKPLTFKSALYLIRAPVVPNVFSNQPLIAAVSFLYLGLI
jgi:hypothetical protein